MKTSFVLTDSTTIDDLLINLDKTGIGSLPIVSNEGKFIGLVTDGDIRRALIKKTTDIKDVINTSPLVVGAEKPRAEILRILRSKYLRQMPVVDKDGYFIEMVLLDEIEFNLRENKVLIMAGGLGSRLKELTRDTPKPMLKVAGSPILEHLIKEFKNHGFDQFILCINYRSHVIKDYFGDGEKHGVKIEYIEEQKRMGTAGGLSYAKEMLAAPFFVINGDVLTTLNFGEMMAFHLQVGAEATLCTTEYSFQIPYATISADSERRIISITEKPIQNYSINSGIYVLNPHAIGDLIPGEYKDMPDLIQGLISSGRTVFSYESKDYWIDIGKFDDYQKANEEYFSRG